MELPPGPAGPGGRPPRPLAEPRPPRGAAAHDPPAPGPDGPHEDPCDVPVRWRARGLPRRHAVRVLRRAESTVGRDRPAHLVGHRASAAAEAVRPPARTDAMRPSGSTKGSTRRYSPFRRGGRSSSWRGTSSASSRTTGTTGFGRTGTRRGGARAGDQGRRPRVTRTAAPATSSRTGRLFRPNRGHPALDPDAVGPAFPLAVERLLPIVRLPGPASGPPSCS